MSDLFKPDLGATPEELGFLHEVAEEHRDEMDRKEKAEQVRLEEIRSELKEVAEPLQKLWDSMEEDEVRSVPAEETGKHIVVLKSFKELRIAETTDSEKYLDGFLPEIEDISRLQVVFVDRHGSDEEVLVVTHWDKDQLNELTKGEKNYFEAGSVVRLNRFEENPPDILKESHENVEKLLDLPEELFHSQEGT